MKLPYSTRVPTSLSYFAISLRHPSLLVGANAHDLIEFLFYTHLYIVRDKYLRKNFEYVKRRFNLIKEMSSFLTEN